MMGEEIDTQGEQENQYKNEETEEAEEEESNRQKANNDRYAIKGEKGKTNDEKKPSDNNEEYKKP